jgi:hypothetical protein
MKKNKIIFYFYNSLFDPLIESNILLYIEELLKTEDGNFQIAIVSHEDNISNLNNQKLAYYEQLFKETNLTWIKLKRNVGASFKNKIKDLFFGFFTLLKLRTKGYFKLCSLDSIAGSMCYLYSLLLRFDLYLYQYEPHSEFALEAHIWEENSKQYKIAKFLEKKATSFAKVISSGTEAMIETLKKEKKKAFFFKITSVVNESKFDFNEEYRREIRQKLKIAEGKKVIIYPGKFGDLYYDEEIIELYSIISKNIENTFFIILSFSDNKKIRDLLRKYLISPDNYYLGQIPYEDMPKFLSASDFGINGIPPTPAQRYRSPIKTGEFLCCGIPYIVCKGISEDDIVAEKENVGVVVENFSENEVLNAIPQIKSFFEEDKTTLRRRSRVAGIAYRGFEKNYLEFKKAISKLMESK